MLSKNSSGYESVVVGGGVAGLSAALVLGRARRRTLLFDGGGQSNRAASHVGGGLLSDGMPPDELYDRGRSQLASYESVTIREAEVIGARVDGDGFMLEVRDEAEPISTQSLILATGMDYEVPDVPGFSELWGDAVFHCPFCHGWDVRDRKLAVYGSPEIATRLATLLAAWTDDVRVVDPSEVRGVRVQDGILRALVLNVGSEIECDAVLVHAPLRPRSGLPQELGLEMTDAGFVAVDSEMRTSRPGVYAAGDLAVAPQQVAVAMGSGHTAALVAVRELMLGRPDAGPGGTR